MDSPLAAPAAQAVERDGSNVVNCNIERGVHSDNQSIQILINCRAALGLFHLCLRERLPV
jgi:hypothetical protein